MYIAYIAVNITFKTRSATRMVLPNANLVSYLLSWLAPFENLTFLGFCKCVTKFYM